MWTSSVYRPVRVSRLLVTALLTVAMLVPFGLGTPAEAATRSQVTEAQAKLKELGYPVGAVDGVDGPQTRRGLCAWRRLSGRTAHRNALTSSELKAIRGTTRLPNASSGRGVTVDKTCQAVYYRDGGRWRKVLAASTGSGGLPRVGWYRVQRKRPGWHTSTRYPAPSPNMYNSVYFDGAIALHGARQVPTYPASKGCVRLTVRGADYLYPRLRVGDPVRVIGRY